MTGADSIKAITAHWAGGPSALKYEDITVPHPCAEEVRIHHSAVGVSYSDILSHRGQSSQHPVAYPFVPGREAAGVVTELGSQVTSLQIGQKVAYATGLASGAYSASRNISTDHLVKVPEGMDLEVVAGALRKGLTVWMLLRRVAPPSRGQPVLVTDAASGVGPLLCQWAGLLGARVIGSVGSDRAAEVAAANGCSLTVVEEREDVVEKVREATDGSGVAVVFDSVGGPNLGRCLDCLARRGALVSFGATAGEPGPVSLADLGTRGSLSATRPILEDFVGTPRELQEAAGEVLALLDEGKLRCPVRKRYALQKAAEAHTELQRSQDMGPDSLVLIPSPPDPRDLATLLV